MDYPQGLQSFTNYTAYTLNYTKYKYYWKPNILHILLQAIYGSRYKLYPVYHTNQSWYVAMYVELRNWVLAGLLLFQLSSNRAAIRFWVLSWKSTPKYRQILRNSHLIQVGGWEAKPTWSTHLSILMINTSESKTMHDLNPDSLDNWIVFVSDESLLRDDRRWSSRHVSKCEQPIILDVGGWHNPGVKTQTQKSPR